MEHTPKSRPNRADLGAWSADVVLAGQERVLELIAARAPLREILDALARMIETEFPEVLCQILLYDQDANVLREGAAPHIPRALMNVCDGVAPGPMVGSCGTAVYRGETVLVTDIATDPLWEDFRHLALPFGLRACWSTPILARGRHPKSNVLGTFAIYGKEPGLPPRYGGLVARAEHLACIAIEADRSVKELRESEARFRAFVDHAGDALFIHDAEARIVEVNQRACASLGYTRDELIGQLPTMFDPNMTPAILEQFSIRLSTGDTIALESVHVRKDGTGFPVEIRVREVNPSGQRLAIVRDITERRSLDEQLRHTQKMEAIGQLAGGIAHDFNNLLTIINASSDYLDAELPPSSPCKESVTAIRDAGERAASLTAQLLAFSRQTIVKPKVLDLNTAIGKLGSMIRSLVGEDVIVTVLREPRLHSVKIDPGHLDQVVINLILNARDAMPDGGRLTLQTANVELAEQELPAREMAAGLYAKLTVKDTGTGIPDGIKARVFDPFFTTKGPGRGTGLGLATVYGIVQQAHGHVSVESAPAKGTTFTILLPATSEALSMDRSRERAPARGTETILVVEDEEVLRRLTTRVLRRLGYEVIEARDGVDALEKLAAHAGTLHLVMTDVVMPRMSGRELADAVKELRPEVKVLFVSGYTDDVVIRRGGHDASSSFLQKPFSTDRLGQMVRDVLDG